MISTRALVLKEEKKGGVNVVKLERVNIRKEGAGEVRVRVSAAAFNRRDWWIRIGKYPGIRYDSVQGADASGVVVSSGDSADELVGKDVVVYPAMGWGDKIEGQSPLFCILGMSPLPGTFSDFCVIPRSMVFPKPRHLTHEQAAALPLAGLTAYRAVKTKAKVSQGAMVLVTGIGGGVATFCAQFAIALGAEVFSTSGSDEKLKRATELLKRTNGSGRLCGSANYNTPDWHTSLLTQTKGRRFDAIIDSGGGPNLNVIISKLIANGGTLSIYGATAGLCPKLSLHHLFLKNANLVGSTMGSRPEFVAMLRLVNDHAIIPIIHAVLPFSSFEQGYETLARSNQIGKVVLSIDHAKM